MHGFTKQQHLFCQPLFFIFIFSAFKYDSTSASQPGGGPTAAFMHTDDFTYLEAHLPLLAVPAVDWLVLLHGVDDAAAQGLYPMTLRTHHIPAREQRKLSKQQPPLR